jgi:hypothetical protein
VSDARLPRIRPGGGRLLRAGTAADRGALQATLAAGEPGWPFFCAHSGPSMNPTLGEQDLLEVLPYGERMPRAGDVVLFLPPGGKELIVHRVVRAAGAGLCTRGDNNPLDDPYTLAAGDPIGQVVAAWRGRRRRRICGGRRGLLAAWLVRRRRALERRLSRRLHPLYDGLARSGIVPRLLPTSLRPTVVAFQAGEERHLRLLWGRRVIGHFDRQAGRWRIRRPFRLLVDVRTLPPRS